MSFNSRLESNKEEEGGPERRRRHHEQDLDRPSTLLNGFALEASVNLHRRPHNLAFSDALSVWISREEHVQSADVVTMSMI